MSNRDKLAFTGGKENNGNQDDDSNGLTKLEYFTAVALNGFCSNGSDEATIGARALTAAQDALDAIDAI